jgi:hypothetical protein
MKSRMRSRPPVPFRLSSRADRFVENGLAAVPSDPSSFSSGCVATIAGPVVFPFLPRFVKKVLEAFENPGSSVNALASSGLRISRAVPSPA